MTNQIDALLNLKDASGTVNEIYPITKKENVKGLVEFVNNAVSEQTPLFIDANNIYTNTKMSEAIDLISNNYKKREILLIKHVGSYITIYHLEQCNIKSDNSIEVIFGCVDNQKIYTAALRSGYDDISYGVRNISTTQHSFILPSTGWATSGDVYTQTVTISGVSATETEQEIHVTPASASMIAYMEAGVYASGQAANQITFKASKKPTVNLTVYVVIRTL